MKSELEIIPGVGPATTEDFRKLGITEIAQLKGRDPEQLYDELNTVRGQVQDRCVLYVFRCAVYYAETENPELEKLKWWNWKD